MILWVKAFHVIFVISWFAGLLYLPRLFVYHATCQDAPGIERFKVMERKLFAIMSVGGIAAIFFGLWLLRWWQIRSTGTIQSIQRYLAGVSGVSAQNTDRV